MAKRTYLELVNDFIDEFGIGGGGPILSVVGQTGDLGRAVRWIKEANDHVSTLWIDWRFLWRQWSTGSLALNSQTPTLPSVAVNGYEFGRYDRTSFYLDRALTTHRPLKFDDYRDFRLTDVGVISSGTPDTITELPDRTLRVNRPADRAYAFACDGWKRPVRFAASGDVSDVPEHFERILIVRGAISYANKEDAPEILEGAEAEYLDWLEKLEASELPDQHFSRMAEQDEALMLEVPGMDGSRTVTR